MTVVEARTSPFAGAASSYLERGWWPLPLPPNAKTPPPLRLTGSRSGSGPTRSQVAGWITAGGYDGHQIGNVAVRMPPGVVGIDVDDGYAKDGAVKIGGRSLAELEMGFGALPPTYSSTARGWGESRIRFYRVPPGTRLRSAPADSIEIVQHHHRYAVAWPSVHPETKTRYEWFDWSGEPLDEPPEIGELTALPDAWIDGLRSVGDATSAVPATPAAVQAFYDHSCGMAKPNALKGVDVRLGRGGSRHDRLVEVACMVAREALAGFYPMQMAETKLHDWWKAVMEDERRRDGPEFDDAIAWAIAQAEAGIGSPQMQEKLAQVERARAQHPSPAAQVTGEALAGPDGYRYTDLGNAKRLITKHGEHLRFVPSWGKWLAYADGRWRSDHGSTIVSHLAAEIGVDLLGHIADVRGDTEKMKALIAHAKRSEMASGVASTVKVAQSVLGIAIDHEALDADPWLLNVRNGTVDLRTGELRPAAPSDLLMMQTAAEYVLGAPAPLWLTFLERVQPDAEVRGLIQRLAGLALVGQQLEHVLAVCIGGGANGKSTATRIIDSVLGDYSVVASKDLLLALKHDTHPTSKADLFRRRFAHLGELPQGAKLDEAQVKELTGGDRITARRMREDPWQFDPSHLLWLHANHRPTIEGTDDGVWRRVLLIPFDVQVPEAERDPALADRIVAEESAGVLAWMVAGLAEYLEHGLRPPAKVRAATASYRMESDTVAMCMEESGITVDPALDIPAGELMQAHNLWFDSAGLGGTAKDHYQRLTAHLIQLGARKGKSRSKGGHYWKGVGLVDEDEPRQRVPTLPYSPNIDPYTRDEAEPLAPVGAVGDDDESDAF